jgi:4-hydroxybenzoate polyprenyltransferase/phosphoserine phosphatase
MKKSDDPSLGRIASQRSGDIPLCVDLDGTLIHTDMLLESLLSIWNKPLTLIRAFAAFLFRGKAEMKRIVAEAARVDASVLPYREDLVSFLREKRREGRKVLLVTATHELVANEVAGCVGVFDGVMATRGGLNLGGRRKRDALVEKFGERGFDYVGDHKKDLPVLEAAREAYLADPSRSLERKARSKANVREVFRRKISRPKSVLKGLRLHQWSKNVLLAVPLVTAHRVGDLRSILVLALGILSFGLQASATYIVNDLHDLSDDRRHPKKRLRPWACGELSIPTGVALVLVLSAAGLTIGIAFLPLPFFLLLLAYTALTLAYSFDLKRRLIVDTIVLAGLYTLRILAGAAAISVGTTPWLLMFSFFFFLCLALLKRYIEMAGTTAQGKVPGRGYMAADIDVILAIGPASGLMSVLVMALYINSPDVMVLYRTPQVLWLILPLLVYWITRVWFLAKRMEIDHDPVFFALTDKRSYAIGMLAAIILLLATLDLGRLILP